MALNVQEVGALLVLKGRAEFLRGAEETRAAIKAVDDQAIKGNAEIAASAEKTAKSQKLAADESAAAHEVAAKKSSNAWASMAGPADAIGAALKWGVVGVAAAGVASVALASNFQSQMLMIQTQAGATTREVVIQSKAIEKMAGMVGAKPQALAQGLYPLESVGLSGAAATDALRLSAEGAAVGHASLTDTASTMASVLSSGVPGIANATEAMGTLNAIVGNGKMVMQDLNGAMSTGILSTAKTMGISLQSVGAGLDTMTNSGMPAEQAATRLRMAMTLMTAPSSKAAGILKDLGMNAQDAGDKSNAMAALMTSAGVTTTTLAQDLRKPNGLLVAMQDLKGHLAGSGMSPDLQNATLAKVFGGARSGFSMMSLYQDMPGLQKDYQGITGGESAFPADFAATSQSFAFQLHQITAEIETLGVKWGTWLIPRIEEGIGVVRDVVTWFGKHHDAAVMLGFAIGGVLVAAIGIWLAVTIAAMAATTALAVVITGGIIIGIAALAAGIYYAYEHFGWFRDAVDAVVSFVQANWPIFVATVTEGAREAADFAERAFDRISTAVQRFIAPIVAWFHVHWPEIAEVANTVGSNVVQGMQRAWDIIGPAVKLAFNLVVGVVKIALDLIGGILTTGRDLILGIIGITLDLLTGRWGKAWNDLVHMVDSVGHDSVHSIDTMRKGAGEMLDSLGHDVVDLAGALGKNFVDLSATIGKGVVGALVSGANMAIGIINDLIHAINAVTGLVGIPAIPNIPDIPGVGSASGAKKVAPASMEGGAPLPSLAGIPSLTYARGGFITNGPQAIVGEGNQAWPEYVVPTDPAHRNRAMSLFASLGAKLMDSGGIVGALGDASSWVGNAASGAVGAIGDAAGWLGSAAMSGAESLALSGAGAIPGFIGTMLKGALSNLFGHLGSLLTGGGGGGGKASGPAPAAGDAMGAQLIGLQMAGARGWGSGDEWNSLVALWNQESGWNPNAVNPSSGAIGIPQALGHGSVFALGDAGAQIAWGLDYIAGRYGSPSGAWAHEKANNWYASGGVLPVASYDTGGYLPVGDSIAHNGTGRPEPVGLGPSLVDRPIVINVQVDGRTIAQATIDSLADQAARR